MGTTNLQGLPYPEGSDLLSAGDDTIKALAEKLDAMVPYRWAAGTVSISLSNASSGTLAVTFPAGRFTQAPIVTVTTANSHFLIATMAGLTATGFTAGVRHIDAATTTATLTVNWVAVQMLPGAAPG